MSLATDGRREPLRRVHAKSREGRPSMPLVLRAFAASVPAPLWVPVDAKASAVIPVSELRPGDCIRATRNGPIHEVLWSGRNALGFYVIVYAEHLEPIVYHPAATLWPAKETATHDEH